MTTANRILEILYDRRGRFVATEELLVPTYVGIGTRLETLPARLERALEELRQRGHGLEVSPASGVRLPCPVRLDAHLVGHGIKRGHLGHNVLCFDQVGSTNDVAFDAARGGESSVVVTAEHQRAGRGRLGRKWLSGKGAGILASVLLPVPTYVGTGPLSHEALTVAAGLAVAEGIEDATGLRAGLAWPNDVVLHGAKLAGVLVETRAIKGRRRTVIGFGVNVHEAPARQQVGRKAACLSEVVGGEGLERIEVLRAVLSRLDGWVAAIRDRQIEPLHQRWCSRCEMVNARVRVESRAGGHARQFVGRVLDVSPLVGLVLATDAGQTIHLPAATSTVLE